MTEHLRIDNIAADNLFRGIQGFEEEKSQSDTMILVAGSFIGLCALYYLGRCFSKKTDDQNILNINEKYKDLVERESFLQSKLVYKNEQLLTVDFMMKILIVICGLALLMAYRKGPDYMVRIASEMPHIVITTPLALITLLYLWK